MTEELEEYITNIMRASFAMGYRVAYFECVNSGENYISKANKSRNEVDQLFADLLLKTVKQKSYAKDPIDTNKKNIWTDKEVEELMSILD